MNIVDFREKIKLSVNDEWVYHPEENISVLKTDLNISIIEAHPLDPTNLPLFNEPWAQDPYADKGALRTIYYVRYGIVVVDVIYCAIIDGGRCVIPLPDVKTLELDYYKFRIGSIINNDDRLYNEYLKRSKIGVQLPL